ncbi:MAG: dehydrogenase subunit [Thermoleophilia bacterium]|nr:dehydrogenase subunit [Thermoleophilia bacterium]
MSSPAFPSPKSKASAHGTPVLWEALGDREHLQGIDEYVEAGGYEQLKRALTMDGSAIVDEIKASNIRGRGGAGFPTGLKMSFIPKDNPKPKYVVCNADESEPCTFKDRELIERLPHMLVEGCLIAARAIGSNHAFIYIRGEYYEPALVLMAAVEQARAKGLVGDDINGSGWGCEVIVHRGAGAYICGEETALLSSLNGYRGQPTVKPPFPAVSGLYESPTLVNNVETLATLPRILGMGGATYAARGVERTGAGTRMMSLSGHVNRPGNYEMEIGVPLRVLVEELGGGVSGGKQLKAIIPGGSSTPVLTADKLDTNLDYDSMVAVGTMFGSGSVIIIDEDTCMAQLALRVAEFYRHESCGKCTPCREGTKWTVDMLTRLVGGDATPEDLDTIYTVGERIIGNCLCPLGDSMAMAVNSYIDAFREDFTRYFEPGFQPPASSSLTDIAQRTVAAAGVSKPGVTWAHEGLSRGSFTPLRMAADGVEGDAHG